MKPKMITLQEATKIAEDYCAKNFPYSRSVFRGMFEGKYLFRFRIERSGHYGLPVFVVVSYNTGNIESLERHSEAYNRAWTFADNYAESLNGV